MIDVVISIGYACGEQFRVFTTVYRVKIVNKLSTNFHAIHRVAEHEKDEKKETVRKEVSAGNVSGASNDVSGDKTDTKGQQPFTLVRKKGKPIAGTTNFRKREKRLNSYHYYRIIPS